MIFSITETLRVQRTVLILCYLIVAHLSLQQYCTVKKILIYDKELGIVSE